MNNYPRTLLIFGVVMSLGLIYLICSCAPAPSKMKAPSRGVEAPAQIQSIKVISAPCGRETTIEIASSKRVPYTAFRLVQPLRLIVDITAVGAGGLSVPDVITDRIIKAIQVERMKDGATGTRVIVTLSQDIEYDVQERDGIITVLLSPKEPAEKVETPVLAAKKEEVVPTEPRLFFSPGKTKLNQILGIDFFMLPKGESRIIVTTSKKAEYELSRRNSLTLLVHIKEATIPRELTRYIDSSYFEAAVDRITPIAKVAEKRVDLEIKLKEMIPYHLIQTDKQIQIDFNKTSVEPPAKRITPAKLRKALEKPEKLPKELIAPVSVSRPPTDKRYTGALITLDIVDADIRNILKLIGEVSNLNIVWGPKVKGRVSMRLKDVPWDQALDIILRAIDLGIVVR